MKTKLTRQFVVSVYADGSIKVTERTLPKYDSRGRFTGVRRPWRGESACRFAAVCPLWTRP